MKMEVNLNCFAGDEVVNAYLYFIKKRNSKEVYIKYSSNKFGFKETMEGRLQINDMRLEYLSKILRFIDTKHDLWLSQKDWKIKFSLNLSWNMDSDDLEIATLSFDNSLRKEVYKHFKQFEPKEIKK